jgi:flagellar protein FlaG
MEIQQLAATGASAPATPVERETLPALPALPGSTRSTESGASAKKREPKPEELKAAVKDIQEFVSTVTTDLRFVVDKETGRLIVSVVDSKTQQILRQIPSEDIMKIAKNIDRMQGLLFNGKA